MYCRFIAQLEGKTYTSDRRIVKLFSSGCVDMRMAQKRRKKSTSGGWTPKKIITGLSAFTIACFSLAVFGEDIVHKVSNVGSSNRCLAQFPDATPPYPVKESLKKDSYSLCFQDFNVFYSGVSKTPLYVTEYLNPDRLDPNKKIPREDNFHEEQAVRPEHRAVLADYRGSGYDRGHMAPNADMNNKAAQYDSFSLANMVPQAPKNNQQVWRELEEATRALVTKKKLSVYVLTGPVYTGKKLKVIGDNKVIVPTAVYKVLYMPELKIASAYLAPNDNSLKIERVSVCALEDLVGISFLPNASEEMKRAVYDLPLKGTQVKANRDIAYLRSDQESQCAPSVAKAQLDTAKAEFVPLAASNTNAQPSSTESSDSAAYFKALILKLIHMLLEMFMK